MRELQEWMYGAITSPEAPPEGEILARLTEAERLDIYRGMYEARMVEALTNDYPALAAVLGEHDFGHLAVDYAVEHPSESYTLNRLGDSLPAFVAKRSTGYLSELAALELAMTEVFDEEETPLLGADAIASITPETRLPLIAALRLLPLEWAVNELFQAFRDGGALEEPRRAATWLVVYRRDFAVRRMPVTQRAFSFLSALAGGVTLGEACAQVEPTEEELFDWFRDWSAAGLLGELR